MARLKDYDTSVNLIVEADHVTKGQFVIAEDTLDNLVPVEVGASETASGAGPSGSSSSQAGPSNAGSSSAGEGSSNGGFNSSLSEEEKKKVEDGECFLTK